MWRDVQRLTAKFAIPWQKPALFPRNSTLAARVGCAVANEPVAASYVRAAFVANFGDDEDIADEGVIRRALTDAGADAEAVLAQALSSAKRGLLRNNTEHAIKLGIFGAPNCVVKGELFWGEEALEDAIQWSKVDR